MKDYISSRVLINDYDILGSPVLAQVKLSSILKVDNKQFENKDFYRWFKQISQQSVDFLICNHDFSVIAAIELDDKTHSNSDAFARDEKKLTILKQKKYL